MIKSLFVLLPLLLSSAAFTQDLKLSLRFNVPATAEITRNRDSFTQYKISDSLAVFDVERNSAYRVFVTAAGYQNWVRDLITGINDTLIEVALEYRKEDLKNVTVVAKKPLITQDEDKTIVDAEVLSQSSSNAYEILEKLPGALVDQDGNVYLNSATPAVIQINGRETKLSAADLASLLKSLPANSVLKIEILRTPSAKFDAGSSGGIVNIVLKKGVKLGTSGSTYISHFQGRYATESAGFSLNKGSDKVESYITLNTSGRKNFEDLSSSRFITRDTSVISQHSYTTYPAFTKYLGAGVDVHLTQQFTIGYGLRISAARNKNEASNDVDLFKESMEFLSRNISESRNNSRTLFIGNSFNSKYKIDTTGSEWTNSLDINFHRNNNGQDYAIDQFFPSVRSVNGHGDISNRKNIIAFQSDLVLKQKGRYTIESGLKINSSLSRNNADFTLQTGNNPPVPDNFQSNKFRYSETISSVYFQLAKDIAGFTLKPGLRMEATDIRGHQLFPSDTTLSLKRTDFFPYVYLRHSIAKMFGFKLVGNLIYRRSISRPYYEVLNPYPRFIDQYLYDVGNPRLKPQFTTNYEFNIMADQFPVFSVGLNDIKNVFTNVTYQDQVTKIAYRTYDNLGHNKEFYLRFVGGIPPGRKYFFYAGAQHNLNRYSGFYNQVPFDYTRGSWLFFMHQNYKPTTGLSFSLHGFMRLRGFTNFYELKSFGALNLSINKTILNKKGNIVLAFNDLLRTNRVDFSIQQAGIYATGSRFNDTRRIGLTFRYNFGIKPKEEKKNVFDVPTE